MSLSLTHYVNLSMMMMMISLTSWRPIIDFPFISDMNREKGKTWWISLRIDESKKGDNLRKFMMNLQSTHIFLFSFWKLHFSLSRHFFPHARLQNKVKKSRFVRWKICFAVFPSLSLSLAHMFIYNIKKHCSEIDESNQKNLIVFIIFLIFLLHIAYIIQLTIDKKASKQAAIGCEWMNVKCITRNVNCEVNGRSGFVEVAELRMMTGVRNEM